MSIIPHLWGAKLEFINYGVDGFKIDDVYEIDSAKSRFHSRYSALFKNIYTTAVGLKPNFAINTCNCGIAQNFYDFPGENQLITSDPLGTAQFRRRAKYLHALNVNAAAILGDHIELTQGDVGPDDLKDPRFYRRITDRDFASTVALGMVLATKLTRNPGGVYSKWFDLYRKYKFYNMKWINKAYFDWKPLETYLMRDKKDLYFSFFTKKKGRTYTGGVTLSHLKKGRTYSVYDVINQKTLPSFKARGRQEKYHVVFKDVLLIQLRNKRN